MIDLPFLIEPLGLKLVQRGMLAAIVVAVLCGVLGTFVVLRGLAFLGDALGHAVFPGVVVAYLVGWNPVFGGLVAGILTTIGISVATQNRQVRESTAIGIFYTAAFALGALLLSRSGSASRGLGELLIGNVLAVRSSDLLLTCVAGGLVLLAVAALYKELVLAAFDRSLAAAQGRNVALLDAVFYGLLALAIVAALQTVGNVLVVALLVVPAATARLLVRSLAAMMLLASLLGAACAVVGVYIAYYADIASGGAIVLCACAVFVTVLLIKRLVSRFRFRVSKP